MSKLICDVCGTSYPETATQCPICGCVRPGDVLTVSGDTADVQDTAEHTYTYVKGGRFSKANVKKRNRGQVVPVKEVKADDRERGQKTDKILGIVVIVLLLAIVAVTAYIVLQLFGPALGFGGAKDTQPPTDAPAVSTTAEPTESTEGEIHCQEIILSKREIVFEKAGVKLLLNVSVEPENTTDEIEFSSEDESIATVTADGLVQAVGPGETVITAKCGNATATCKVVCQFESAVSTDPTETTAPAEDTTNEEFKLNSKDFTLFAKGEKHDLYNGKISDDQITWSTSNEKVATVKNGVVTAVGTGYAVVTAEYKGEKFTCEVRCSEKVGAYTGPLEETNTESGSGKYELNKDPADVTISIQEKFSLCVLDADGKTMAVTWKVADSAICSVDGNTITGLAPGWTKVTCTYDGETFTCIIRVKAQ
jgi:hypothetical protein